MKKTSVLQRRFHPTPDTFALLTGEVAHLPSLISTDQPAASSSPLSIYHDIAHIAIHASKNLFSASLPIQAKSPPVSVETSTSTRPVSHRPLPYASRASDDHSFASLAPTRSLAETKEPHQERASMQPTEATEATENQYQQEQSREQQQDNRTGLPDALKAGVESLSGFSLDDVRVHYHSSKPAEVGALAYTQGTQIHVGSGQEQHLAHEAWHVVQQKRGRVMPTLQAKGLAINADPGLEYEADMMGREATDRHHTPPSTWKSQEKTEREEGRSRERGERTLSSSHAQKHQSPSVIQAMFWEATDADKYIWHEDEPDAAHYTSADKLYQDAADKPQYPVYYQAQSMRALLHEAEIGKGEWMEDIPPNELELACWNWALSGFAPQMVQPQYVFQVVNDPPRTKMQQQKMQVAVAEGGQWILENLQKLKAISKEWSVKKRRPEPDAKKTRTPDDKRLDKGAVKATVNAIVAANGFTIVGDSPFQIAMHYTQKDGVTFDHWWLTVDGKIIETFPNKKGAIQILTEEQSHKGKGIVRVSVQALKPEQIERIKKALKEGTMHDK